MTVSNCTIGLSSPFHWHTSQTYTYIDCYRKFRQAWVIMNRGPSLFFTWWCGILNYKLSIDIWSIHTRIRNYFYFLGVLREREICIAQSSEIIISFFRVAGSHTGIIDAHWSSVQKQAKNIAEADISFILFHSSIF